MKKLIFALICALVVTLGVNAQQTGNPFGFGSVRMDPMRLSNQQIASILANSKESLNQSGVANLDIIYPGKYVTFTLSFEDGYNEAIAHHVKKGDNLWNIVRYQLHDLVNKHGDPVKYRESNPLAESNPPYSSPVEKNAWFDIPFLGLTIGTWIGILIMGLILFVIYKSWSEHRDPTTSGRPMVAGGVGPQNAFNYMKKVAERLFPGDNIDVIEVERGLLSVRRGLVRFFNLFRLRTRTFTDVPGYRGRIVRNGQSERDYVYFLEPCANDVRRGRGYRASEVIFRADITQPDVLRTQNQGPSAPSVKTETSEKASANKIQAIENAEAIAKIVEAVAKPMEGSKSGELEVEVSGIKIKMKYSGITKETMLLKPAAVDQEEKVQS